MGIQLLPLDATLQQAIAHDAECQDAHAQGDWPRLAVAMQRLVGAPTPTAGEDAGARHWGGYVVIDDASHAVVGSCAFKGAPTDDGTVEIAYFTYPGFEGQGYATAMATRLIALASASPQVRLVTAHTLPEANASTRILEKVGMQHVAAVIDPDDGPVWRWECRPRA